MLHKNRIFLCINGLQVASDAETAFQDQVGRGVSGLNGDGALQVGQVTTLSGQRI